MFPASSADASSGRSRTSGDAVDDLVQPDRFENERARLAEITEEELPLAASMLRQSADQFSPDLARERVADWTSRRHGDGEEPGWQSTAEYDPRCDRF